MHTISDLRKILGLATTNQVRNRIEAIKDVLADYLRRGPNNQILVSDAGVESLRRLQELHDSGLTITEASEIVRSTALIDVATNNVAQIGFAQKRVNPEERDELVAALKEEIAFLRERVAYLERQRQQQQKQDKGRQQEWWEHLKEGIDGP